MEEKNNNFFLNFITSQRVLQFAKSEGAGWDPKIARGLSSTRKELFV